MANLLEQAINCDDGDRAAKIIQNALGICFPETWPEDRQQRANIIGYWLQSEASFLAVTPPASRRWSVAWSKKKPRCRG
jgi:hypothetical protein